MGRPMGSRLLRSEQAQPCVELRNTGKRYRDVRDVCVWNLAVS